MSNIKMRITSAPNYGQSAPTRTHSNFSQLASILLQCKCRANIVTQLASILFSNNRAKWGSNTVAKLSHDRMFTFCSTCTILFQFCSTNRPRSPFVLCSLLFTFCSPLKQTWNKTRTKFLQTPHGCCIVI